MKWVIGSVFYMLCTELFLLLFFSKIFTDRCKMQIFFYSSIVWMNCIMKSEIAGKGVG